MPPVQMRLDELARHADVASTTVRLYQNKGLLPGPQLVGRVGWYDDAHLTRLRLIAKLQADGFSLAGISRLLSTWERGRDLADLVGVERELDSLLGAAESLVLDPPQLAERFPEGVLTPDLLQRSMALGLVEPTDDGRFRVPDPRFLDTGAALAGLGVPSSVILDEWERLVVQSDEVAGRFVAVFEQHLLPPDWRDLDGERMADLAAVLGQLRRLAASVLAAALDASMRRIAAERLSELVGHPDRAPQP